LRKLGKKFLGLFKVTWKVKRYFYQVNLPEQLKAVYPVFHILQLELAVTNTILEPTNLLPPSIKVNSNLEFKIAYILDSKLNKYHRVQLMYYVQWVGYEGIAEEYS